LDVVSYLACSVMIIDIEVKYRKNKKGVSP